MGRVIEGFWDCPFCDTKGIRGSISECPTCGKVRDASTKFYLNKSNMRYLSEEEKKNISTGPDWFCPFCESYNPSNVKVCKECGHEREEEDLNYHEIRTQRDSIKKIENNYPETRKIERSDLIGTKPLNQTKNKRPNTPIQTKKKKPFKILGIGAILLLFTFIISFFFIPKEETFEVTSIQWEYGVEVEEYRTIDESGWSLPSGARLHYSQEEIYEYKQVLDHYETKTRQVSEQVLDGYDTVVTGHKDLGNGYFEEITSEVPRYRTEYRTETYEEPVYRQDPIYRTKYYYEIDKWMYDRTLKTKGNDKDTYFDDYEPAEKERLGDKNKKYEFYGIVDGKNKDMEVEEHIWNKYDVGDEIPIKINRAGIITIIENSK